MTANPDPGSAATLDPLEARELFPILGRRTYLNSCSLGALSTRSEAWLDDFQRLWHEMGASAWYAHWLDRIEVLRRKVAAFHGAPADALALLPSTSAALSVFSECFTGNERTRVVTTELDFPTLVYQWQVKPEMEVVVLRSRDGVGVDPEQFRQAVDERTLFVATSHVYFTTGYVQDLDALAEVAHSVGAHLIVDGYQGAGQIPLRLAGSEVDMYTSGPLKWLCGGPGLAYMYVREELVRTLKPRITSWFATEGQFDFDPQRFRYRDNARRFELGTPALATVHTALGGQEIIDEVGMDVIRARNRHLADHLIARCREAGFSLRLPEAPERRSAIVMIRHDDPPGAVRHLAAHDVIVDYRPGHVRVSPHFYNTEEELDRMVEVLASA